MSTWSTVIRGFGRWKSSIPKPQEVQEQRWRKGECIRHIRHQDTTAAIPAATHARPASPERPDGLCSCPVDHPEYSAKLRKRYTSASVLLVYSTEFGWRWSEGGCDRNSGDRHPRQDNHSDGEDCMDSRKNWGKSRIETWR